MLVKKGTNCVTFTTLCMYIVYLYVKKMTIFSTTRKKPMNGRGEKSSYRQPPLADVQAFETKLFVSSSYISWRPPLTLSLSPLQFNQNKAPIYLPKSCLADDGSSCHSISPPNNSLYSRCCSEVRNRKLSTRLMMMISSSV